MVRRGACLVACALASSCGGAAFDSGDVRVVPDRAYVFDDGDRVYASAYVTAYAEAPTALSWDVKVAWQDDRFGDPHNLMLCSEYRGFVMDESEGAATLGSGERRDVYVRASAGTLLRCNGARAIVCGEPVSVLLVPRGAGLTVPITTTAECFYRVP